MSSEKLLVYIGGTPGCATMHIAAFVHLHPEAYCFNTAGGAIDSLRSRFGTNKAPPANVQGVPCEHKDFLLDKNAKTGADAAFSKKVLAIRDDEAWKAFANIREKERRGLFFNARRSLYIYPVRRNLEEMFWTWNKGIHPKGQNIEQNISSFKARLTLNYAKVSDLIRQYGASVHIVNLSDPDDRKAEWLRLLSILGLEASEQQKKWIESEPRTNTFGERVRLGTNSMKQTDFYRKYVK